MFMKLKSSSAGGRKLINTETKKGTGLHPNNQISAILRLVAIFKFLIFFQPCLVSLLVQSFIFTLEWRRWAGGRWWSLCLKGMYENGMGIRKVPKCFYDNTKLSI